LVGVTSPYTEVMNYRVADGRFISEWDVSAQQPVIVLGAELAKDLFEDADPVGQEIIAVVGNRRQVLRVVGVMEPRGQAMGGDLVEAGAAGLVAGGGWRGARVWGVSGVGVGGGGLGGYRADQALHAIDHRLGRAGLVR